MSDASFGILIVDDEESIRRSLASFLTTRGYSVKTAGSAPEALRALEDGLTQVVFQDLKMPGCDGIELGQRLLSLHPGLVVIIMTAYGTVESVVGAMRVGMYDYLVKPVAPDALLEKLGQVTARLRLSGIGPRPPESEETALVCHSSPMQRVRQLVRSVGPSDQPVLICGEKGTGKKVVARAIAQAGARPKGPFVIVGCAGRAEDDLDRAIFAEGGGLAAASGGMLLLDQVGGLPLPLQQKLLRVLSERSYWPTGSTTEIKTDARILATTSDDPQHLISTGRLREDLYYRIGKLRIDVPPLRQRIEDLPYLALSLVERAAKQSSEGTIRLAPSLTLGFLSYPWPGNVRELENVITSMAARHSGDVLSEAALPPEYRHLVAKADDDDAERTLVATVSTFERRLIEDALTRSGGDIDGAARELGLAVRSLRRKLWKIGYRAGGTAGLDPDDEI